MATGAPLRVLDGHTDWVRGVACAALGEAPVAVTASADGTARVWDLATGAVFTMPIAGCNGLAVCGATLLAATHLGVIAIDLRAGQHGVARPHA